MKFGATRIALLILTIAAVVASASAGTVSISSPSSGATVSSPVHVVASASSSSSITAMKIYLDGNSVYSVKASKIDTYISTSTGSHKVTVKAWDSSSNSFSSSVSFTVGSSTSTSTSTSTGALTPPSTATTFSKIEQMSGWGSCSDCAGAGGGATYTMTQNQSSPALDGNSTKFSISGTVPFSHGLWWRRMSSNTSATNFILDMYYYMKNPGASQGLEFAANQGRSDGWYKFSTQCSFGNGNWSVWDSKNGGWVKTGIPCTRPTAYAWQHVRFEYQRSGGKAVFVAITINGTRHYVNKSFYPQAQSSSGSVGIHFQLNGNSTETAYSTWADKMTLTYW